MFRVLIAAATQARRSPLLTAGVGLLLALGIGANAVVFGIADRLLLRPPEGIAEPQQVRLLYAHERTGDRVAASSLFSFEDYDRLRESAAFERVAAFTQERAFLGHGPSSVLVDVRAVSGEFFDLLGTKPRLGRLLGPEDEGDGADKVAVLGHAFWMRHFGASETVLGQPIQLGKLKATVIGVAPPGFTGFRLRPVDVWVPLESSAEGLGYSFYLPDVNSIWLGLVARLDEHTNWSSAEDRATAVIQSVNRDKRPHRDQQVRISCQSLIVAARPDSPGEADVARWLSGVSLAVLLIACASVANLLLTRSVRRRAETALRLSLGMGRPQLLAQQLAENIFVAAGGGLAAIVVAYAAEGLVRSMLPELDWSEGIVSLRLVLLVAVLSLVAAVVTAIVPVWQTRRIDFADALKAGSATLSGARSWPRSALLIAQTTFSTLLLVGASLFLSSLSKVETLDLGFEAERVLVVKSQMREGVSRENSADLRELARQRLSALPGVVTVGAAYTTPLGGSIARSVRVPGMDQAPKLATGGPYVIGVEGDYFATLGIQILQGRALSSLDRAGSLPVAVIDQTMAENFWPTGRPVGGCLHLGEDDHCTQVVGVAQNVRRQGLVEEDTMQFWVPSHQLGFRAATFFVKTTPAGPTETLLRRELYDLDDRFRHVQVFALDNLIDPKRRPWQLGAALFSIFGALALLVAGTGLYGALAFEVAQRGRELGIRAALGATAGRLMASIVGRAVRLTAIGVLLGLTLAAFMAPYIEPLLFRTQPFHPTIYSLVASVLLAVAVLASLLPSWRASASDPNETLRAA